MPSAIGYKQWAHQIQETNKCAKDFLAGKVPEKVMAHFFDHESQIFEKWRDGELRPFEKDWSEDYNR